MQKKLIFRLLLLSFLALSCGKKIHPARVPDAPLRVLGYLFSHGNWAPDMAEVDLTRITDLNLAFINPDSTGRFLEDDGLHTVVEKAHSNGVTVFMSIGGGDPPPHFDHWMTAEKRSDLIQNILSFARKYHFDGVDVDIENDLIDADYAPFVTNLSAALKPAGILMTSALASWNSGKIGDTTLQLYDFINIMSYDKTGPWNLSKPGPHSPYSMAVDDFRYFHETRGIPAEKLLIGLPFYGYGFGPGAPRGLAYSAITATYPGAENKDEVTLPEGGAIYYNGIPTIRRKVEFAVEQKAGGVMIWQLRGDASGELSLLKVIHEVVKK